MKILFLFLLSSCSFFIESIEKTPKINLSKKVKKPLYCINEKISLYTENSHSKTIFKEILEKYQSKSFIEKSLLWTTFQFYYTPESFSPNSRLQILLKINGSIEYYDFSKTSYPALSGLNYLTQLYTKNNLSSMLNLIEKELPKRIPVNSKFADLLSRNKSKNFDKVFYKAEETLKEGETFPKRSLSKSLNRLKSTKAYEKASTVKNKGYICSSDINSPIIYPNNIHNQVIGLSDDRDNFFIASASLDSKNIKISDGGYIIHGDPGKQSTLCYKNEDDKTTAIVSFKERSPQQILLNLIESLPDDYGPLEIDKTLRQPRKMVLPLPNRVIVEEKISSKIPQFHTTSLGRLLIYHKSSHSPFSGFINDPRSGIELECP